MCYFFRANLSDNYFTNRQDRYVQFNDCPEMCNFFAGLVKTVSTFSLSLTADNCTKLHPEWEIHPYEGIVNEQICTVHFLFTRQFTVWRNIHVIGTYKAHNAPDKAEKINMFVSNFDKNHLLCMKFKSKIVCAVFKWAKIFIQYQ